MSLRITKDNIYLMNPQPAYFTPKHIYDTMSGDFTLYVKVKINQYALRQVDSYIISRSGAHSGISALTDVYEYTSYIQYTYWFWNNTIPSSPKIESKQIHFKVNESDFNDFIELAIVHDSKKRIMICYYKGENVGEMVYDENTLPVLYDNSPYWFGCGSMLMDGEKQIGDFEYGMAFCVSKTLSWERINDITTNYKEKYCEQIFENELIFKRDWELTDLFSFFCDFKQTNRYKIWNYAFNGNFPQLYIDNVMNY